MNKHPSLKVKFNNDFTQLNNSEFVEGTALIAYQGDNKNSSDIIELAFTNAMPSLSLIPIVGNWLPEKQNFGGHDIAIEWQGNTLVLKDKTVPYGVVKENHNAQWVELEDNGVIHKYLQADVVLWAGRYPEQVQKVIDDGINQSMEISISDFNIKENGNFQINSFEYSALCLLGKDIDENGELGVDNVEPCFEQASVIINKYNFNEQFKSQFNNLLFEFNNQISELINNPLKGGETEEMKNKGGNTKLDEKSELLQKYNLTSDVLSFSIEELSIEQLEEKIKEHFALLVSQKREEISNALREEKYTDRWGDQYSKYSFEDNSDSEVFAYDRQDNYKLFGFTYSMVGDSVIIDFATKKRKKFEIVDFIDGESATMFNLFPQEAIDYAVSDKEKELTETFSKSNDNTGIITEMTEKFNTLQTENVEIVEKFTALELEKNTISEEFESLKIKVTEYETNISTLTEQFNSAKSENETLTQSNQSLLEFKSNTETAQQEAFESKQLQLKLELVENFSKVLTAEEIKLVQDKDLSTEEMEKEFKLIYADKDLQAKFNKKPKKIETEIPLNSFTCKKKDDWTSCIKK